MQVVVNFEPDTEIIPGGEHLLHRRASRSSGSSNFEDDVPDTVPYASWVRVDYRGWDDPRDSTLCADDRQQVHQVPDPVRAQVRPGAGIEFPHAVASRDSPRTRNCGGTPDSTTINVGSAEYTDPREGRGRVRESRTARCSIPQTGAKRSRRSRSSGTTIPTLDSGGDDELRRHDRVRGRAIRSCGIGGIRRTTTGLETDTLKFDTDTERYVVEKIFYVELNAAGHDHPTENARFGMRGWNYSFLRTRHHGTDALLRRARRGARAARPTCTTRGSKRRTGTTATTIPAERRSGPTRRVFWNLEYEFSIYGRDIALNAEFNEYIFTATGTKTECTFPPGYKIDIKEKVLLNSPQSTPLARTTGIETVPVFPEGGEMTPTRITNAPAVIPGRARWETMIKTTSYHRSSCFWGAALGCSDERAGRRAREPGSHGVALRRAARGLVQPVHAPALLGRLGPRRRDPVLRVRDHEQRGRRVRSGGHDGRGQVGKGVPERLHLHVHRRSGGRQRGPGSRTTSSRSISCGRTRSSSARWTTSGLASKKPAYRSFTSRTLSPVVDITVPDDERVQPRRRFRRSRPSSGSARDYVNNLREAQDPDSVRWILVPIKKFNGSWGATLDYIRTTPGRARVVEVEVLQGAAAIRASSGRPRRSSSGTPLCSPSRQGRGGRGDAGVRRGP